MSKSEDYLDQLLKGMATTDSEKLDIEDDAMDDADAVDAVDAADEIDEEVYSEEEPDEEVSLEEELLGDDDISEEELFGDDDFEEELLGLDESFLEEFEQEMQRLEADTESTDGILEGAKEQMEATPVDEMTEEAKEDAALAGDFSLEDFSFEDFMKEDAKEPAAEEAAIEEPAIEEPAIEEPAVEEPAVEETAIEEPATEELAIEEPATEEIAAEEIVEESEEDDVLKILDELGDIDIQAEIDAQEAEQEAEEKKGIESAEEADMDILKQLGELDALEEPAPEEDKKKKKEKKKNEKKPKEKKEKKPKPKKEKKPKPPKEPDNTPPLPKKPTIAIFALVASVVVFIIIGTNLFGYANQMKYAQNAYAKKQYSEAFSYISGLKIKERDEALYGKYQVMALVSSEVEAYDSFFNAEMYEMALDCLVRTVGRYEKYKADAEIYGCIDELNELEWKAETILSEIFAVSREEALELYSYNNRKEYSAALIAVVEKMN